MQATYTKCFTDVYNLTQNEKYVVITVNAIYFLNSGCQNDFGLKCSSNLVSGLGSGVEGEVSILVPAGNIRLVVPR
jgi:hypothetical protein